MNTREPQKFYILPIWDTFTTAWNKTISSFITLLLATVVATIITLILAFILIAPGFTFPIFPMQALLNALLVLITIPLQFGIVHIAIKHVSNIPISLGMMFDTYKSPTLQRLIILTLLLGCIVGAILIILVLLSFFVGGISPILTLFLIYMIAAFAAPIVLFLVLCRLGLSFGFVIDANMSSIDAIKTSLHVTRHNFFRILLLGILYIIIYMISVIPFGIGLIWTVPLGANLYAVMYKRLLLNLPTIMNNNMPSNI